MHGCLKSKAQAAHGVARSLLGPFLAYPLYRTPMNCDRCHFHKVWFGVNAGEKVKKPAHTFTSWQQVIRGAARALKQNCYGLSCPSKLHYKWVSELPGPSTHHPLVTWQHEEGKEEEKQQLPPTDGRERGHVLPPSKPHANLKGACLAHWHNHF